MTVTEASVVNDCKLTAACKLNAVPMYVLRLKMQQEVSTLTDLFPGEFQLVSVHTRNN